MRRQTERGQNASSSWGCIRQSLRVTCSSPGLQTGNWVWLQGTELSKLQTQRSWFFPFCLSPSSR